MIEIRMNKCILCLTTTELLGLLAKDRELWRRAIQRGKHVKRADNLSKRQNTKSKNYSTEQGYKRYLDRLSADD
jgi:hypothetical protein